MIAKKNSNGPRLLAHAFLSAVVLAGCASTESTLMGSGTGVTASDPSRMTRTGFLTDYAALRPVPDGGGAMCWRRPDVDLKRYDKILIERIQVMLKPGSESNGIDPTDLKMLVDYFHNALVKALQPQMQIVDQPGPGVIRMRIALTELVPTSVGESVLGTAVPYGFVAEAASGVATGRPAGSTPYLGVAGIEMQFRDGATSQILGECRDAQIGRKYAADLDSNAAGAAQTWASGYLNSFTSWSYAKDAFDKWAAVVARRFAQLRGVTPQ
ncbi:MAG: DUF3313 domain-containing protein [Burkholderiales bacterium]|nr:DUF3313 domain-containing protein [Burkholderiales bacterium]